MIIFRWPTLAEQVELCAKRDAQARVSWSIRR